MANDLLSLPPGFHFAPTAEELLQYYLPRRQMGEVFGPFLQDVDLYSNDPWNLFHYDEQSVFYVFTGFKKRSGKRVQRKVGSGTWMGQSNNEVKDRFGNVIGIDRYFNFKLDKGSGSDDQHGRWTMHEFAPVNERGEFQDNMVVCVIGHDTQISTKPSVSVPKKKRRTKASPTDEDSRVQIDGSDPTHSSLIPSEAESAQPHFEFDEGVLMACLDAQPSVSHMEFDEGVLMACLDAQPSVSISKKRKRVMASPTDEVIDGSDPTHYVLQENHTPSEAEEQPCLEFNDEGELWAFFGF